MTIDLPSSGPDWVPDSCTLPTAERPVRVAEFDAFCATSVLGVARTAPDRLELVLAGGDAVAAGRALADRESACCSLFTFTFTTGGAGPVMVVEVPDAQVPVLDALAARVSERVAR